MQRLNEFELLGFLHSQASSKINFNCIFFKLPTIILLKCNKISIDVELKNFLGCR
jgi:hypothetical protein